MERRWFPVAVLFLAVALGVRAQSPPAAATSAAGGGAPGTPPSDVELVEHLLAARKDYQISLEQLRAHYIAVGDVERARWAE